MFHAMPTEGGLASQLPKDSLFEPIPQKGDCPPSNDRMILSRRIRLKEASAARLVKASSFKEEPSGSPSKGAALPEEALARPPPDASR